MTAVDGAQPHEGHTQLAVTERPARGCIRLIVLANRRTEPHVSHFECHEESLWVANAVLDLNLAHAPASAPSLKGRRGSLTQASRRHQSGTPSRPDVRTDPPRSSPPATWARSLLAA
jgi:hypothetical protein